jgi:TRAP-type mannitol/chloroaromatic compound transport system substrate-binding protein
MKTGSFVSIGATSAAALLVAGSAFAAEVTVTAITSLVQQNPLSKSFVANFVGPVNAACKGQFQVKYLGGPENSPPRNAYKAVQRGQFDVLHGPTSYYIGAFPEAYGMLASNVPVSELHKNGGYAMLDKLYQTKVGAKLVAWGEKETGYYTYLMKKPKVGSDGLPDLSGMKMRASGTYRPLFQKLGASTVNMKESEIYTGLQRGVVQGFGWPVTGVPALGLHKIAKYFVTPSFYKTNTTVTMNLAKWNSLSKAQKDCIDKVARPYENTSVVFMEKERIADEKSMRSGGMQPFELKGDAAKKYLTVAYDAIWAEFEKRSKDSSGLKAKLYRPE